jgi:hypothetical protein
MIALSIRQPWAWVILHRGKDVENRTWPTKFRGRLLIHAAKIMRNEDWRAGYMAFSRCAQSLGMEGPQALDYGGIVGSVELVDCVTESASPWFAGPFGFVLRNPQPLPFRPFRGRLRLFEVPERESDAN